MAMAMAPLPEQGFGCMGMSAFYSSARQTSDEDNVKVFHAAVENGVQLFNTATFYGALNEVGYGENLRLIKKCLVGIDRSKIQLMVKIGMDTRAPVEKTGTQWIMRGDRESIRKDTEYALEQLGVDYIDILVLCRVPPKDTPVEEWMAGLVAMVKDGKARSIGLSEASADTLRAAHSIHPIHCIEQEWSLYARDAEVDLVPACRALGIKIVAYSPLGRGFLTGQIKSLESEALDEFDFRKMLPKYAEENMATNLKIVEAVEHFATTVKQCSAGQLALAWLHAQGSDVIPIPGTTKTAHLLENLAAREIAVSLSAQETAEINAILAKYEVQGARYGPHVAVFQDN